MNTNYWQWRPAQKGQLHYIIFGLITFPVGFFFIMLRFWLFKKMYFKIQPLIIWKYDPIFGKDYQFNLKNLVEIRPHKFQKWKTVAFHNVYLIFDDDSFCKLRLPLNKQKKEGILSYIYSFL